MPAVWKAGDDIIPEKMLRFLQHILSCIKSKPKTLTFVSLNN
jgi:hypothetical protein